MIIVKLQGGLGNQMFQYAFGRALAYNYKTDLVLDTNWFSGNTAKLGYAKREYQLDQFNNSALDIDQNELFHIGQKINFLKQFPSNRGFHTKTKWLFMKYFGKYTYISEKQKFIFDVNILPKRKKNTYVEGYWQNELYFSKIEEIIRKEFQLKDDLPDDEKAFIQQIEATNSICIHVRRGDYVVSPKVKAYLGVLPMDYYLSAVEYIKKKIINPVFYVFSDEPEWCSNNLQLPCDFHIASSDNRNLTHEMVLMSHCRHQIIANSSFSWWAAWLNTNNDKIVIAPRCWRVEDARSPVPDRWIKM